MNTAYIEELRHWAQKTGAVQCVLAAVAIAQGFATFFGLRSMLPPGTVEATVIPIVVAPIVALVFYMIWHVVCGAVPLLHSPVKRALGLGFGLGLAVLTVLGSSWYIATAIGGDRAVQAHMQAYIGDANRQLGILVANATAEEGLMTIVGDIAAAWRGEAERETKFGSNSGKPGAGPRASMLVSAASSMEALAGDLKSRHRDFEALQEQTTEIVADMTKAANAADAATPGGQARFSELASRLFQAMKQMERTSALAGVKERGFVMSSGGGGEAGIANLSVYADKQTQRLRDAAKGIESKRKPVEMLVFSPVNAAGATLDRAGAVPRAWVAALTIDLLPLAVLLLMMLLHAEAREPHEVRKRFSVVSGGRDIQSAA